MEWMRSRNLGESFQLKRDIHLNQSLVLGKIGADLSGQKWYLLSLSLFLLSESSLFFLGFGSYLDFFWSIRFGSRSRFAMHISLLPIVGPLDIPNNVLHILEKQSHPRFQSLAGE